MALQMGKESVPMKRFCRQLENIDATVFSVMGQNFLFSANTLTYFPLTECATELLFVGNKVTPSIFTKYSKFEIEKTCEKITELEKSEVLSPVVPHKKGRLYYNDYYLKLVQSTRCNLRCSYCFARKDKTYDMSVETAKKAILFFLDKFVPDEKRRYIIDLTGSGEPLLRLDFILEVNEFVLELKKERGINIFCQLATNGMLLTKETGALLKKNCILFGVSLDGPKDVSEKNRTGLKYDVVSKNINDLENKDFFGLAATYSANNHDFIKIFKTLHAFNPEVVGMKPVRLKETDSNSINLNNIEEIKDSYDRFAKWLYKQITGGREDIFTALIKSEDYFARFLKTTLRPFRVYYRCSAGVSSFAVDGKENIIICPAFVGNKDGIIGNLTDGIAPAKKRKLERLYADKISFCKNCWARYTCAGECFAVGYENSGKIQKPAAAMCELKKYLIQLSVWFWTCLRFEHPDLYKSCIEEY